MEPEEIKTCNNCHCQLNESEPYHVFGRELCYECTIDEDPDSFDYQEE